MSEKSFPEMPNSKPLINKIFLERKEGEREREREGGEVDG